MKVIETCPREIGFVLWGHCQNLLDDPRISLISSLLLKMAVYVSGYWMGIHFKAWYPIFDCIFCIQSNLELKFSKDCGLCQDTFSTYKLSVMLRICRPNFMKFMDR